MNPQDLRIWVHTWWKRGDDRNGTLASLDASDARGLYTVECQSKEEDAIAFYCETLARMCREAAWILRFEDDVLVNRHIVHNVLRWRAPEEPDFGIGFLSSTAGVRTDAEHIGRGATTGCLFRKWPELHTGGCMLIRSCTLEPMIPAIGAAMRHRVEVIRGNYAFSCAPSHVMWDAGLRSYMHEPNLVMPDLTIPRFDGKLPGAAGYGVQAADFNWRAP